MAIRLSNHERGTVKPGNEESDQRRWIYSSRFPPSTLVGSMLRTWSVNVIKGAQRQCSPIIGLFRHAGRTPPFCWIARSDVRSMRGTRSPTDAARLAADEGQIGRILDPRPTLPCGHGPGRDAAGFALRLSIPRDHSLGCANTLGRYGHDDGPADCRPPTWAPPALSNSSGIFGVHLSAGSLKEDLLAAHLDPIAHQIEP